MAFVKLLTTEPDWPPHALPQTLMDAVVSYSEMEGGWQRKRGQDIHPHCPYRHPMQWIRRNPYLHLSMLVQCNECRTEPLTPPFWHCGYFSVDYCKEFAQRALATMLRKLHETM